MQMPLLKKLELKYKNLKNQFPKGQASGENITINDSSNLEFDKFNISGNSIQDGEPNLENKVDIKNCGKDGNINFKITNKNLFNAREAFKNLIQQGLVSINDKGQIVLNGEIPLTNFYVYLKKGTYQTKEDTNTLHGFWDGGDYYFGRNSLVTIKSNAKYRCYLPKNNYTNKILEPMIYKTDIIDKNASYVINEEQNISIPVQQSMLEGDYFDLARKKEVHNWDKVVLDGEKNAFTYKHGNIATDTQGFFMFSLKNKIVGKNGDIDNCKCDYLKNIGEFNPSNAINETGLWWQGNSGDDNVYASLPFTTLEDANNCLKNNPITIYYKTKTQTELDFIEEQRKVFNQLKELHTYKGTTHIYSTDEVSPIFEVEYSKDLETILKG